MNHYSFFRDGMFVEHIHSGTDYSNLHADCICVSGEYGPDQYYDSDRKEVLNKGPQPSESHVFNYVTKSWEAVYDSAWAMAVQTRNRLLGESDWVVVKATETGTAVSSEWVTYRQALRDITDQADPFDLVWPVLPV